MSGPSGKSRPAQGSQNAEQGCILAHFGVAVEVGFEDGSRRSVRVKRNSGHVVGDWVEVRGEVLRRLERRNVIERRDAMGSVRTIGANLDILCIVIAPKPATPAGFVDRAMVAARAAGVLPVLVVNKCDLPDEAGALARFLADYEDHLPVLRVSTKLGHGLAPLEQLFSEGLRGAFVGVSGVGKSSLLNSLCPEASLEVGALSEQAELGRHTTTVATLHTLPEGGELVDTPGFRDFGPVAISSRDLAHHFCAFDELLHQRCKFGNCLHRSEPGCRVLEAVACGRVPAQRHSTYLELLCEMECLEREPPRR